MKTASQINKQFSKHLIHPRHSKTVQQIHHYPWLSSHIQHATPLNAWSDIAAGNHYDLFSPRYRPDPENQDGKFTSYLYFYVKA